jgi:hypothetical protein
VKELAARRTFQQLEKETQQEKKNCTRKELRCTLKQKLQSSKNPTINTRGRKKERKKELGIPQKQQRYELQRYAEF